MKLREITDPNRQIGNLFAFERNVEARPIKAAATIAEDTETEGTVGDLFAFKNAGKNIHDGGVTRLEQLPESHQRRGPMSGSFLLRFQTVVLLANPTSSPEYKGNPHNGFGGVDRCLGKK